MSSSLRAPLATPGIQAVRRDPPFNSNAAYNLIFNEPSGGESQAQIRAFDDTWRWDRDASQEALAALGRVGGKPELVEFANWLANNISKSTAAYLAMMAVRLMELYRVLKPSGSLYLHCDPTASHYLKIVIDAIFGARNFENEIIWRRTGSNSAAKRFGPLHQTLFYYTKSDKTNYKAITQPVSSWPKLISLR